MISKLPTNIYQIVNGLRYFGLGAKVVRDRYAKPDTYWVVTKTILSKDQNHGKIWGRYVYRGKQQSTKNERIGSALKKEWLLVDLPNYSTFKGRDSDIVEILSSSLPYEGPSDTVKLVEEDAAENLLKNEMGKI